MRPLPLVLRKQRNADEASVMAATVSSKIEDGNIKAAIRILPSDDKPAPNSATPLLNLLDKHPRPAAYKHLSPDDNLPKPLQVAEADILQVIRSFLAGSSGGPNGLRPQHILKLVTCKEIGTGLMSSIAAFANLLLKGKYHDEVAQIIFGGSLIALSKKSGGIRPIAIGYAWRRLAAKCANTYVIAELADYFSPIQLGVGVPGGCEATVHATRRFAEHIPDD